MLWMSDVAYFHLQSRMCEFGGRIPECVYACVWDRKYQERTGKKILLAVIFEEVLLGFTGILKIKSVNSQCQ